MAVTAGADRGPVAIVTGAGSGIGRATAVALARAGHRLAIAGRTRARLEETAAVIAREASGREAPLLATADLARREEAFGVVDATLARWGRIDVLVNNAGWGKLAPIAETGEELMRTTFAINFFAAANLIQRAWPAFLKQRSATVVNVSSWAAHDPFPGFFAYAASKAALESLARSIANDVEKLGLPDIRAYSVAPGAVETPLLRAVFSEEALPRAATLEPEVIAARILDCVQGRAGVKNGGSILVRSPG